jgi:phosphohistidine swiveling domain-containing protein/membrane-associated phospholipid phosphatase
MVDGSCFTLRLSGEGQGIAAVGGKGAQLDQLVALGMPVPDTAVITTDAYRAFVRSPAVSEALTTLRASSVPAPREHERQRREIDELFLAAPMPPGVAAAIAAIAGDVGRSRHLAIRSSATAEDQSAASFAGQYRSFLDVEPADVERAVRLTWASLWHPAPRSYRRYHGIAEDDLAMAVVVMAMLDPQFAGVAFSRDPLGHDDVMRIELVRGLGESLVSGAETPEAFVLDRSADAFGLAAVCPALVALPAIVMRLERAFGAPQDIEWAVERDQLWILQARPITAGTNGNDDGFDVHASADAELTTAGIAEMLPGVLPPRLWAIDSWLVEEGLRRLFVRLGGRVENLSQPHALLARYRGRAALDLGLMRTGVSSIPGGSPEELEHQYFGSTTPGVPASGVTVGMRQGVRTLRARATAAQESETVVATIERVLTLEPDITGLADDELLAFAGRIRHLAARAMAAEVAIAAMAAAGYRGVEALLARHLDPRHLDPRGESAMAIAQRITGAQGAGRSAITLALGDVAAAVRRDERLVHLVSGASDVTDLAATEQGADVAARYRHAIRRAGSMAVFAGPTWEEEPAQAWRTFQALVARPARARFGEPDRQAARSAVEKQLHDDRRWRVTRVLSGQLVDARKAFVRREANDAADLLDRRERTKAAVLMLGGLERRVDLEIGARLVARGRLDAATDIQFLAERESAAALLRGAGIPPATVDVRRRRLAAAEIDGPLPHRFRGDPPPVHLPVSGTVFHGWGASTGRYEGRGRVAESPVSATISRGDVLVARSTDSSWAPLFLVAGAIVVEEGGPLSHAAIVARELGVPAVLNVPGIVDRLAQEADDVMLTVDGVTGEVAIHRPADHPADGVVPVRAPLAAVDAPEVGMRVFVTGLIGAGALLSLVMTLTEAVSSTPGRARLRRRAEPLAVTGAAAVIEGFTSTARSPMGLRPRRWYAAVAALLLLAAGAIAARSTEEYGDAGDRTGVAVVAWAVALSSAVAVAFGATGAAVAAWRWPRVPLAARRWAPARRAAATTRVATRPSQTRIVAPLLAMVAALALMVAAKFRGLQELDERIYDSLGWRAGADRWAPDWMNLLGRPAFAITLAIVMALFALRCRVLALAIPSAIVGTGLTIFALTWLTGRERPGLGGHSGEHNSFPSGHSAQVTLLFGLLPLAVHAVTGRRWAAILTRVAACAALVVMLADTVRTGGHWPSDHLGGFLIALAIVVVVHARYAETSLHSACRACPRMRPGEVR